MEQADFINYYITNLVTEVQELTKTKILSQAKENYKDAELEELRAKIKELEETSASEKDVSTKTWKDTIDTKDQESASLTQTVTDLRAQIEAKNNLNASLTDQVNEMHRNVKDKENIIVSLNDQLAKINEANKLNGKAKPEPELIKKLTKTKTKKSVNTLPLD